MSNYADEKKGIAATLAKLSFSDSLKTFIKENVTVWPNFGKMNSHLYREKLLKLMDSAGLSQEARFMVFFFFSVIKNQPRVLKAMDTLPSEAKTAAWFDPTKDFIAANITQYVSQTSNNNKMPAVNIPGTNPGFDILVYCLITSPENRTLDALKNRPTFSQLKLNADMQLLAKTGYDYYWDVIVVSTRNPVKLEEPKSREEYYVNSASDKYLLLDEKMNEIPSPSAGYDKEFLENYLKNTHKK